MFWKIPFSRPWMSPSLGAGVEKSGSDCGIGSHYFNRFGNVWSLVVSLIANEWHHDQIEEPPMSSHQGAVASCALSKRVVVGISKGVNDDVGYDDYPTRARGPSVLQLVPVAKAPSLTAVAGAHSRRNADHALSGMDQTAVRECSWSLYLAKRQIGHLPAPGKSIRHDVLYGDRAVGALRP